MALITINSIPLPNPISYGVTTTDFDSENSTRNEGGYLQRNRIRAGIRRIDVKWLVSKADYLTIAQAIAPDRFTVHFFDPASASVETAIMYAGDRGGTLNLHLDEERPEQSRWELSVPLVEY